MLVIKKRHTVVKAITAGSVAFAIGLTGASAFIGTDFQPDTTVYNQESARAATKNPIPVTDSSNTSTDATASGGSETVAASSVAQPVSTVWAPAPAAQTTAVPSPTTSATQTLGQTTPSTATAESQPAVGSDSTVADSPSLLNEIQSSCPVKCLTDTTTTIIGR